MKRKTIRNILLLVLVLGLAVGGFLFFSGERIQPTPPLATTRDTTLIIPQSELIFPVNFGVKELCDILNTAISGTFFKAPLTINERGDIVDLELKRSAPITITWQMPYLEMRVPLHMSGVGKIKVGKNVVTNKEAVESDLVLTMRSQIDISSDWKLKTKSTIQEITWVKEPIVKIAFLKLNLRKKVDEAIKKRESELLKNFDQQVGEKIELKKAIGKIWRDIQRPVRVNKKEVLVWLMTHCDSISALMVDKGPTLISIQVACYTQSEIVFDKDTASVINRILPPYTRSERGLEDRIELYIGATIPYSLLNKKLNEKVGSLKIGSDKYSIKIKKVEVYGTDSALAVKVNVRGDIKGDIYLTAKVYFDPLTNYIGLNDVRYDVNTQNSLVQTADWIFHDSLPAMIGNRIRIPLDSLTNKLPLVLGRGIEDSKVGKKLDADIVIDNVGLTDMIITKNDIQLIARVRAIAKIQIEKEAFSKKLKPIRITSVKKK
ncbi:MAG: hypothetical protein K0S33_3667 [Bacteroidetes bacterium]|nr:hypothetical protein [Bacteroidota bacterium]